MSNYNLKELVVINRDNSRAMSKEAFGCEAEYKGYICAVNTLRKYASKICQLEYIQAPEVEVKPCVDGAFDALRACYRVFNGKDKDNMIKPCADDLKTIKSIVMEFHRNGGKEDGKDYQATSETKFRKAFECFVSDRLTGRVGKTATQIEAERKAKNEARRAARAVAKAEAESKETEEEKKVA